MYQAKRWTARAAGLACGLGGSVLHAQELPSVGEIVNDVVVPVVLEGAETVLATANSTAALLGGGSIVWVQPATADSPGSMQFTLTRRQPVSPPLGVDRQPIWVNYGTKDGTARAGVDYQAKSGTIYFDAADLTQTVSVQLLGPNPVVPKTFSLVLDPTPYSAPVVVNLGQGIIADPRDTATGAVATATGVVDGQNLASVVVVSAETVLEPSGYSDANHATTRSARFELSRDGSLNQARTFSYRTTGVTATQGADFASTVGTVTMAAGQSIAYVYVPILRDSATEAPETFLLQVSAVGSPGTVISPGIGVIEDVSVEDLACYELALGSGCIDDEGIVDFVMALRDNINDMKP